MAHNETGTDPPPLVEFNMFESGILGGEHSEVMHFEDTLLTYEPETSTADGVRRCVRARLLSLLMMGLR